MKCRIKNDCRGMDEYRIIETILAERDITDVDRFLNPQIEDMLPLDDLKNIDEAFLIVNKILSVPFTKIMVLFDTDTDGICSGTIITRYLHDLYGRVVETVIDSGKLHGLQDGDLWKYRDADLLIIVDSLDSSEQNYRNLREDYGVENIIVLDHHAIDPTVPYNDWITLVSSQTDYANPSLSGAGVTWKFCKYCDARCNTNYADQYIDLAAAGIVADMMDMTVPENRYIVSQGLSNLQNPAMKKIVGSFGFNSTAVAFSIAPAVNAANRLDKNESAMQAFLADDNKEVLKYVKVMKKCKEDQNIEVDTLMEDIEKQCKKQSSNKMIVVFIDTDYGVAGLIANKLLEKYKRPILVLKENKQCYSGSMRAVGVEDFRKMLNDSGMARAYGHELAAGVDIDKSSLSDLIDYMEHALSDVATHEEYLEADIWLNTKDITRFLIDKIKELDKISGTGFKPIRVYINDITDFEVGQMSDYKHLVIRPDDGSGLTIIKWNWSGDWDDMEDHALMGDELEMVASLDSGWLGKSFMLKVICDYIGVEE